MAKKRIKTHACPNCKFSFSADIGHTNFCPNCGQENHNPRYPFLHYIYELIESITHFDNKFWHSFKTLIRHPGRMTKDYIENVRGRYTPPVRLLIVTIAAFIFIDVWHSKSFISNTSYDKHAITESEEFDKASDSLSMNLFDAPFGLLMKKSTATYGELRSLKHLPYDSIGYWLSTHGFSNNPLTRLFTRGKKIKISRNMTSVEVANFQGKILYVFPFIIIPFFALIYFIFFYRKKLLLYDTMIFSIHTMTVMLVVIMTVQLIELLIRMIFRPNFYLGASGASYLFFSLPFIFNLLPAAKKVFAFGWLSTVARTILSWVTLILLMIIVVNLLFAYWT